MIATMIPSLSYAALLYTLRVLSCDSGGPLTTNIYTSYLAKFMAPAKFVEGLTRD